MNDDEFENFLAELAAFAEEAEMEDDEEDSDDWDWDDEGGDLFDE